MPVNASIYQILKPVEFASPLDAANKAAALSQMSMQNQKMGQEMADERAVRGVFSKNVGPDGKLNREAALSELARVNPKVAMQYQESYRKQDAEALEQKAKQLEFQSNQFGMVGQIAASAKDQPSYEAALAQAQKLGLDTSKFPSQFDPVITRNAAVGAWKASDRASAQHQQIRDQLDQQKAPLERGKIGAEIDHLRSETGKKANGRPLAAEQSDKLAGHDASFKQLDDLEAAIRSNTSIVGPYAGRLSAMNPYNTRAQDFQALAGSAAQKVGKSLEGGKLTDADIERYKKMLPTNTDTPDVALQKIAQVRRMVAQQQGSDLDTYGRAGIDVSKFSPTAVNDIEITKKPKGKGGGAGVKSAYADDRPNFDQMSAQDLKAYLGGK